MRIVSSPFEAIPAGRVFAIHGGPLTGQRVVFTDTPVVDSFEAQGATYRRTSCGFRVDPLVDPVPLVQPDEHYAE
jgi:hypothetical protein